MLSGDVYFDIAEIHIAHEFVLDGVHRCEYPNGRGCYGLVYALEGRAEFRFVGGERLIAEGGTVLLLPPHAAYSIVTENTFRHYTVNFDLHKESSRVGAMDGQYLLLARENAEPLRHHFERLSLIWRSGRTGFQMQAKGCLYELLSLCCFGDFSEKDASVRRLLPAREYIEKHFSETISLDMLARLCSMSVTNFRREWEKHYPEPPIRYRDGIRLYYAREYLASGYYTVSEVARRCGFEDVSYFVRFFKKKTGITPGDAMRRTGN